MLMSVNKKEHVQTVTRDIILAYVVVVTMVTWKIQHWLQVIQINLILYNENEEDTKILNSSTQMRTNVLLKTAVAHVWLGNTRMGTYVLLDEGALRSFLTDDLAKSWTWKLKELKLYQRLERTTQAT